MRIDEIQTGAVVMGGEFPGEKGHSHHLDLRQEGGEERNVRQFLT